MKYDVNKAKYFILSILLGAFTLSLFSIPQKYILGADQFVLKGFIVPVFFGASIGVILFILLRRIRINLIQKNSTIEALQESEERFHMLFKKAPLAMAYVSMEGKILDLNDLFHEMTGYDKEDIPTLEHARNQCMPDPALRERMSSKWLADLKQAINENTPIESFECTLVYKDGSEHDVIIGTKLIGEIILTSFFDISERKRDAEAIDFERRQLLSIFNNLNEIIYVSDPFTYEMVFANQRLRNITGKESSGELCYEYLQGFKKPCDFCTNDIILNNGGQPHRWEYQNPVTNIHVAIVDQIIRWPDGRDVRLEFAADITDKKQTEEALTSSERKLRSIFEAMTDVIVILDAEGRYLEIAPTNTEYPHLWPDELIGKTLGDVFPSEKANDFLSAINQTLSQGRQASLDYEFIINDREVWFSATISPLSADRVVWVARDITSRKLAEEALREREEKYRLLADNITDNIWIFDLTDLRYSYVSPSVFNITGYTAEEATGFQLSDALTQSSVELVTNLWEKELAIDHIEPPSRSMTLELEQYHKVGSTIWTEASMSFIRDQDGRPKAILGVTRDISERKKLQSQLQQAQKMETIGRLAGGIAHDFNNVLQAILGYSELARQKILADKDVGYEVDVVIQASERASELVNHILSFSRQNQPERKQLNMGLIVKEALNLLRASIPMTIEIRYRSDTVSDSVLADPSQMHQVIMNLCTNAAHAMSGAGGVLDVILESVTIDEVEASRYPDLNAGRYQRLSVSDTGHGMDKRTLARIFDPFFTTKKQGEGTGMGMSVVHGIIKNHHGAIMVYSEPGVGTTFHVYVPAIDSKEDQQQLNAGPVTLATGSEHILYVDDEALLVEYAYEILTALGYKVTSQQSSLEALSLFRQNPYQFDLVITDQTMPQLTGIDLAREMLKLRSDIPIILCTGFSAAVTSLEAKAEGIREFVMKPLLIEQMSKTIRAVLEEKDSGNQPETQVDNNLEKIVDIGPDTAHRSKSLPLKILVADDDPTSRKLLVTFLENENHRVVAVKNGREVLAILDRENFDLIVMDGDMPEIDGVQATVAIRAKEKETESGHMPIIGATGYSTENDKKVFMEAGFDGFISKPISPMKLLHSIEEIVNKNKK